MNKGTAIVGFLLCFIAGMGLMWGVDRNGSAHQGGEGISAASEGGTWSDEDAAVPVSSKDPVWGNRTAPVTLVLFSDFQCPFCSKVETTITQLKEKYGPDKLRVVWKSNPLPFHPNARPASLAAETVFRLGGSRPSGSSTTWPSRTSRRSPREVRAVGRAGRRRQAPSGRPRSTRASTPRRSTTTWRSARPSASRARPRRSSTVTSSAARSPREVHRRDRRGARQGQGGDRPGTKADKVYAKLSGENKAKAPAKADAPKPDAKPAEDDKTVWKVPAGDGPVKGGADALVTIVQFSDFQCPFCSRVEPTVDEVMKAYGDKVRLIWRNNPLPFHLRAEPAAELAMEARAEKGDKGF